MTRELQHDLEVLAWAYKRLAFALAVLVALACNACTPTPEGRLVDADAALTAVFEIIGQRPAILPRVYVVAPDPECMRELNYVAFRDSGMCVAGLTLGRDEIYLVDESSVGVGFSRRLPHEAQHALGRDHDGLLTWAAGTVEARQIAAAQAMLLARPELDRVPGAGK
jgi:hypothetical protein